MMHLNSFCTKVGGGFMDYISKDFGNELKALRKNRNLTQEQVVELTGGNISRPTLQRYESGKYTPSIEALAILSSLYHIDLYEHFYIRGQSQYHALSAIEKTLKKNLDITTSKQLIQHINALLKSENHPYYLSSYYLKISFLAKGVYLKHMANYRKANYFLLKALRMQFHNFNLNNYAEYSYFSIDYRILLNFIDTLTSFSANFLPKAIEIYQFMAKHCPVSYEVYPHICLNLGFIYLDKSLYTEAYNIFTPAIKDSQEHLNYQTLAQLYYGKATAEYFLSSEEYISSLLQAYFLAKSFGNIELEEWLIKTSKDTFHIDLPHARNPSNS